MIGHTYNLCSNYSDALLVSNMKNNYRFPGYISLLLVLQQIIRAQCASKSKMMLERVWETDRQRKALP